MTYPVHRSVRASIVLAGLVAATVPAATAAAAPGNPLPQSSPTAQADLSPLSQLAAGINTVGVMDFPASYGGMLVTDDQDIKVYVAGNAAALIERVGSLAANRIHVTYLRVKHSLGYLNRIAEEVATDNPVLEADGFHLDNLSPDVVHGTLSVVMETPPGTARPATLSSAAVSQAEAFLGAHYGTIFTVQPTTATAPSIQDFPVPCTENNRNCDFTPFWGGDSIAVRNKSNNSPFSLCSTAFAAYSPNYGNGVFTAGHCVGDSPANQANLYTNCAPPYEAKDCAEKYLGETKYDENGNTAARDWQFAWSNGASDYETVYGGNALEYPTNHYQVVGWEAPFTRCCLTEDPAGSGEVAGLQPVTFSGGSATSCQEFSDNGVNNKFMTCGVGELRPGSNSYRVGGGSVGTVCQGGDSGGPVYERQSTYDVKAVGIHIAGGNNDCYYELLSYIFSYWAGAVYILTTNGPED